MLTLFSNAKEKEILAMEGMIGLVSVCEEVALSTIAYLPFLMGVFLHAEEDSMEWCVCDKRFPGGDENGLEVGDVDAIWPFIFQSCL